MKLCLLTLLFAPFLLVSNVREITDPASYSAGTMSEQAIDQWFRNSIPEENFNLWHGKKERIYLHGAWKFRLLENSVRNQAGVDSRNRGKSADGVETDYGETNGFHRKLFQDSDWNVQPVPYTWIDTFPKPGKVKGGNPYADRALIHEGWYRKKFQLPASWENGRVFLQFRGISWKADVYLNGKRIGSYENSRPNHLWVGAGRTEEMFEFDLTDNLNAGTNTLAVKLFSPYRNGGIWQEVFLERRPAVFADKILITPDIASGELRLRTFFVNTTGKTVHIPLVAELKPWKSFRYERNWQSEEFTLSVQPIPAGRSEQTFRFRVGKPHLWSPEQPNLYHLILRDAKNRTVLAQERFGFRTFGTGRDSFLLNGKKIYLRGENSGCFGWSLCGVGPMHNGFGVLNKDRRMETMLKNYQACGYNLFRANGAFPLELYFDIADEIGLMFTTDDNPDISRIRLKNGTAILDSALKETIRKRCVTAFNHPSVVTGTFRNEAFEKQLIGTGFETCGWAPILNAMYEEYQKWDSTRPWGSSSGRGWKDGDLIYHPSLGTAKADYDICHPYGTNRKLKHAETDSYSASYRRFKNNYTRENGGSPRIMFVGESSEFYTFAPASDGGAVVFRNRKRDFSPHIRNGEFDRKWLAKNLRVIKPAYLSEACEYSLIPLLDSVNECESYRIQAWHNRQIIEQFRRLRSTVAGYILHLPGIFRRFTFGEYVSSTFQAAKLAQQPVLACFSGFAPRNLIAKKTFPTELYLINDSEHSLNAPTVTISQKNGPTQTPLRFPSLQPGEMWKLPVTISADGPDGESMLILTVHENGKEIGRNEFEIFVQDPAALRLSPRPRSELAVWGNHPEFQAFLKRLRLSFHTVNAVPENHGDILLLLPGISGNDLKTVAKWVEQGGKAIALELDSLCDDLRLRTMSSGFRDWTELTLKRHPLFAGLGQDQFRYWNGKEGDPESMELFRNAILPLNDGVLAMSMTFNYRMGMTVAEFRHGNGRWLISQLRALERLGYDSVATRYLFNLLDYTTGGFNDPRAPQLITGKTGTRTYSVAPDRIVPIDLRPYANMGFRDDTAHDRKGGWSDHGPDHDARMFPVGKRTFAGILFDVIDPAQNNGKSCLVLRGGKITGTGFLPDRITGIKIGRQVEKLYFLMTSKYTPKAEFAALKIKMNIGRGGGGGTIAEHTIPLTGFRNLGDWWNVKEVPEALIGWRTAPEGAPVEVGVYVLEWTNPERNVEVESIDFISNSTGIPILIGISAQQ